MGKDNNGSTTKKLLIGVAVGAVLGGAYYVLSGRKKEEEDPAAFTAPPASKATAAATGGVADSSDANAMASPTSSGTLGRDATTTYSFSVNEENEKLLEEALAEAQKQQHKAAAAPKADAVTGRTTFKNLGVSIGNVAGWIVNEEMSPMPNVAMITFTRPEFQAAGDNQLPGSTPVVILSVEDITAEGLNLAEFKEKSKNMALTQMMMMTGGMFQPQVTYDDSMSVGPFGHCLEYMQSTPYFNMKVLNLLQVCNGLAFVFQLMASPEVMNEYKSQVMAIAKGMELSVDRPVIDFEGNSCVVVRTDAISLKVPSSWMEKTETQSGALITFRTSSMTKGENVSVYSAGSAPRTPAAHHVVESGRGFKAVTDGTHTVISTPLEGATDIISDDASLVAVLRSIAPNGEAATPVFRSAKFGYEFEIARGGKIIESRLGDGTVVYAPQGIPNVNDGTNVDGPIVTIRVGDKTTDPDCESTLDEWFQKLRADADSAPISELRKTSVNGIECITFVNKEMQESGPGQREERMGRVYIFVVNEKTTLIRWETSTGNWRKFEKKLDAMMGSFRML